MRSPIPVTEFKQQVADWASKHIDYTVQVEDINYALNNKRAISFPETSQETDPLFGLPLPPQQQQGELNDHAYNQLRARYKAPRKDWSLSADCPNDLHGTIYNRLAEKYIESKNGNKAKFLLRTRESEDDTKFDTVRAVLSDQYGIFDFVSYVEVFEKAQNFIDGTVNIYRPRLADEFSFFGVLNDIRFNAPDSGNGRAKDLRPGAWFYGSEIGTRGIGIAGAVYDLVCANGQYTLNRNKDYYFYRTHRWIDTNLIERQVATGLANAFKLSEKLSIAYIQSIDMPISNDEKDLKNLVNMFSSKYGLVKETADNWLSSIKVESSRYGRADDVRMADVLASGTELAQTLNQKQCEAVEQTCGTMLEELVINSNTNRSAFTDMVFND